MIGKIGKSGKGFPGTINYLLDGPRGPEQPPHRVTWTETRNLFDPDPRRTARYMRAIADTSTRVKKPVYHFIISWTAAEVPSPTIMAEIADATCRGIGLDEHQRLYVAHHDTQNPHVHVVVNRIHPTRHKAWKASHDYGRLERIIARLSQIHGFTFVPGRHNQQSGTQHPLRQPKSSAVQMAKRRKASIRPEWTSAYARVARQHLVPHFEQAMSWEDLEQRLSGHRITLAPKGQGLVLVDPVGEMKLSSLGKGIRLPGLETKFTQTWKTFNSKRVLAPTIPQIIPVAPSPIQASQSNPPTPKPRRRQSM